MNDRVISLKVYSPEEFLYIEHLLAYSHGIYTTAALETHRYEKSL